MRRGFLAVVMVLGLSGGAPAFAQNAAPPAPVAESTPPAAPSQDVDQLLKKIEGDPASAPAPLPSPAAPPLAVAPTPVAGSNGDAPPAGALSPPTAPEEMPAQDVSAIPALPPKETAPEENLFFDSNATIPASQMKSVAPHKVDPAQEPALKYPIVVSKYVQAGMLEAQLVSAQRAIALGRYDSALRIYDSLYARSKRDPNILFGRAVTLQKLGREDEAVQGYEEVLKYNPRNTEAKLNMLGLMGQKYPAVALQRLKALGDEHPNDVGVLAQIGVMEASIGQYDEALSTLGAAAGMEPENPLHFYNMAVIADRAGKRTEAIDYYQKALDIDSLYAGGRGIPRESALARLAQLR